MNCNSIRKYFYAFIDGELSVERNIEVLAHLEMCYECSRRVEVERMFQKSVKQTVCKTAAPDYLKQKILKHAQKRPGIIFVLKENLLAKSRLIHIGALATILIFVVSFLAAQNYIKKNSFFHIAEAKYHALLMKQLETDVRSQSDTAITEYIHDTAGLKVTLPEITGSAKLVGAAVSRIKDEDVPLVLYMAENTPVALYIVGNESIDVSSMEKRIINNSIVYRDVGDCGDCQIISWQGNDNQYIMVSMLNSDKMLGMFTRV